MQTTLHYLINRNLFSNHYLEELIQEKPEWKEDISEAFAKAKKLYKSRRNWKTLDEAMLEDFLIKPVLEKVLGHYFIPQARAKTGKKPDYAFFENENDLDTALENKETDDLYLKAISVGDAKSWKTLLDKKVRGTSGSFEFQNPSFQIDQYLHITPVQWGILTNGQHWRIYYKETSYKLDSYYDIDLATILETDDIEGFRYFYLFFRREAFIKGADGKSFLDSVYDGSVKYAKEIGDNLQRSVYEAMKILSRGFFLRSENGLEPDENTLREVQKYTLKLLYRLLFIFYAESRKLLDTGNPTYKTLSLESVKYDIANKIDNKEPILSVTTEYWNKLGTLFSLINEGSASERFNLPKEVLDVPAYNGGLFDIKRNPFLHEKKIGDDFVARAIECLAREDGKFIDYSTLGTRQLGSIYEGLLEYRLKVADVDLVAVKEKGREKWIPKAEAEGKKTFDEIPAGEIHLATDKGERKATGSYYTPDYIVKYIVRNTLEPILEEKRKAWSMDLPFLHDILEIRVLDPAMGSGHFLVEACEFLANKLVEAWGEARPEDLDSEEVAEHDVHWARREVVRHCIFGVDLNPMAVELAKLSLWLETVATNKPLTFLDHHLKVGNSLIGARVDELKTLPSKEKKDRAVKEKGKKQTKQPTLWDFTVKRHFEELLAKYGEFAAHPDDDLKTVKEKEQEYDALQKSEINRRLHELANVHVSVFFGTAPPHDEYAELQNEMNSKDFPDWGAWRKRDWFKQAQEIAGDKSFFHWELEFPEIFFEGGAAKENPGWDAVVGNPPYVRQEQLGEDKNYLQLNYKVYNFASDIFAYFYEKSLILTRQNGFMSFISNTFSKTTASLELRSYLKNSVQFISYTDFSDLQIFDGATTYPIIPAFRKNFIKNNKFKYCRVDAVDLADLFSMGKETGLLIKQPELLDDNWTFESETDTNLKNKIRNNPKIGELFGKSYRGVLTGLNEAFIIDSKKNKEILDINPESKGFIKAFLEGRDLNKWAVSNADKFLILFPKGWTKENLGIDVTEEEGWNYIQQNYPKIAEHFEPYIEKAKKRYDKGDFWWELRACDYYPHFETGKIAWPNLQNSNKFSYDDEGFYVNAPAVILPTNNKSLLCILNSKLAWFFFKDICVIRSGGFVEMKPQYFEQFPVNISESTTPPEAHAALLKEAKALYSEFLGAHGSDDSDRINRIDRINASTNPVNPVHPVQNGASSGTAPDGNKVLEFVSARLSATPEESDVVHDLLAYLAERMIEMNKEKNAEIKGFLGWFEGEIGAPVEELTNKTAIKAYYETGFDVLTKVLAKNKKKLKEGYDPTRREPKEKLQDEFNVSIGKLAPLLERIKATDGLIDAIVYKLYELTEDEIKIVEESVGGKQT